MYSNKSAVHLIDAYFSSQIKAIKEGPIFIFSVCISEAIVLQVVERCRCFNKSEWLA